MTDKPANYFTALLLRIYPCKTPFSLKVIKKKPKTMMGSYSFALNSIRVYDGWGDTHVCLKTAIHEYAHHLHQTEFGKAEKKQRPHGPEFWQIYGQLIWRAKQLRLFEDTKYPVIGFE